MFKSLTKGISTPIAIIIIIVLAGLLVGGVFAYSWWQGFKPKFPDNVSGYTIYERKTFPERCEDLGIHPDAKSLGISGEVCIEYINLEYRGANNRGVFVRLSKTPSGKDVEMSYFDKVSSPIETLPNSVFRVENHEIGWFPEAKWFLPTTATPDTIITQEFSYSTTDEGHTQYQYGFATGDNPVTQWFLEEYSPKEEQ